MRSANAVVSPTGTFGRVDILQTWDTVTSEATALMEAGPGHLDAGSDSEDVQDGSDRVPLRIYGAPVNDRGHQTSGPFGRPTSGDEDDYLPTLGMGIDAVEELVRDSQNAPGAEMDNPNEAFARLPSEVYSKRRLALHAEADIRNTRLRSEWEVASQRRSLVGIAHRGRLCASVWEARSKEIRRLIYGHHV